MNCNRSLLIVSVLVLRSRCWPSNTSRRVSGPGQEELTPARSIRDSSTRA